MINRAANSQGEDRTNKNLKGGGKKKMLPVSSAAGMPCLTLNLNEPSRLDSATQLQPVSRQQLNNPGKESGTERHVHAI
jgi:hypothetical protein